jgi:hypothetical protein
MIKFREFIAEGISEYDLKTEVEKIAKSMKLNVQWGLKNANKVVSGFDVKQRSGGMWKVVYEVFQKGTVLGGRRAQTYVKNTNGLKAEMKKLVDKVGRS